MLTRLPLPFLRDAMGCAELSEAGSFCGLQQASVQGSAPLTRLLLPFPRSPMDGLLRKLAEFP
jgi:hypothetical protein